jgi:hypothetical protein
MAWYFVRVIVSVQLFAGSVGSRVIINESDSSAT